MTERCPTCKTPLNLKSPLEINQSVICDNCGLELEVVWLYPLELAKVINYRPDPTRQKTLQKKIQKK
jgi:lysine biosynthesis protein LysW